MFLYILLSINGEKTYVGIAEDIERRLSEHNRGKCYFTHRHAPWKLVYSEKFSNRVEARYKKKFFKSTGGRRILKKIINTYCGIV